MFRKRQPVAQPERMIVGLGNPGPEYRGTRHNVGFEVVEGLAEKNNLKLKSFRHQAQYGIGTIAGKGVLLAKPLTYMNLSGSAVAALARAYGIQPGQILVISDDLDLPLGKLRLRAKGGAGGHNGHKSIIASLGTGEYPRLRIGIGRGSDEAADHVLSRFMRSEMSEINDALESAKAACEEWLKNGIEQAMQMFNTQAQEEDRD